MLEVFNSILKLSLFVGMGTYFTANDPYNPNPRLACYHRDLNDASDVLVAHRTLPCRTKVIVCNLRNNKCAWARVADRGPYGKHKSGTYRAEVDMSLQLKKRLDHNGFEPVALISLAE